MMPTAIEPRLQAQRGRRWARMLAWACVFLSLAVFGRRGLGMWRATGTAPGVSVTSGFEEESFFALWRAVHGRPVYSDSTRQPYASAYFNWLFYFGYAQPVGLAVHRAGDRVIPRASRLVSMTGALAGAVALGLLLRRVLAGRIEVAWALAAFVFFGPLVGWWGWTLRPDIWALAFETTGLLLLLLSYRARPLLAATMAGLLFYCAWSCKQTYLFGLATAVLFLAVRRQWRAIGLLAAGSVALWFATFALAGPGYRAAVVETASTNVYLLARGFENLRDLLVKCAPLWLMLAALLVAGKKAAPGSDGGLAGDARTLGGLGLIVTFPLAFAAGCKLGAFSYYYFSASVILALLVAGLVSKTGASWPTAAGFCLAGCMQLLALLGYTGKIGLDDQADRLGAVWAIWQNQSEPRFSSVPSLNLPWLNPGSPPLVLAYNYWLDRSSAKPFEHNGVGGLIVAGYFQTLLLPAGTGREFDGGSLQHYSRGVTTDGLTVFHRKPLPPK